MHFLDKLSFFGQICIRKLLFWLFSLQITLGKLMGDLKLYICERENMSLLASINEILSFSFCRLLLSLKYIVFNIASEGATIEALLEY